MLKDAWMVKSRSESDAIRRRYVNYMRGVRVFPNFFMPATLYLNTISSSEVVPLTVIYGPHNITLQCSKPGGTSERWYVVNQRRLLPKKHL